MFSNGAAGLWKRGVTENRILVDHLLKTELTALAEAMEGTVAQSIVDPENPKTALSVRAMLTAHIGALEFLPDTGKPFSIRDWVSRKGGGGFLFLTSRGDQHASLRGLISTLARDRGQRASLARPGRRAPGLGDPRRTFPPSTRCRAFSLGLAESLSVRRLLRARDSGRLGAARSLWEERRRDHLRALRHQGRAPPRPTRDTAQWSADSLGRAEIEEISEAYSYGANTMRDGVSLTPRRELRSLALPSEIMRLPNLTGYLKLPGPWPVAAHQAQICASPHGGRAVRAARGVAAGGW